jgi:hypothetical protein
MDDIETHVEFIDDGWPDDQAGFREVDVVTYVDGVEVERVRCPERVRYEPTEAKLGSLTSEQTQTELEEVAVRRAASTGQPVVVSTFASSGEAHVEDVKQPVADATDARPVRSYADDFSPDEQVVLRQPGGPLCEQPSTTDERAAWRAQHPELHKRFVAGINEAIRTNPEPRSRVQRVSSFRVTASRPPHVLRWLRPVVRQRSPRSRVTTSTARRSRTSGSASRDGPREPDPDVDPPPSIWRRLLRRLAGGDR